jgi:hypothetical protein
VPGTRSSFRTPMLLPIKPVLRLYFFCGLLMLTYQLAVRLEDCVGLQSCSIGFAKAVIWSLIWPFIWGLLTTGSLSQATVIFIASLLLLFAARGTIARVFAASYTKSRAKIWLPLYAAGCLITLAFQVGVPITRCAVSGD